MIGQVKALWTRDVELLVGNRNRMRGREDLQSNESERAFILLSLHQAYPGVRQGRSLLTKYDRSMREVRWINEAVMGPPFVRHDCMIRIKEGKYEQYDL